jgi:hypothetical protein
MKKIIFLFLLTFSFLIGNSQKLNYSYKIDSLKYFPSLEDSAYQLFKVEDFSINFYIRNDTSFLDVIRGKDTATIYPTVNMPIIRTPDFYVKRFTIMATRPYAQEGHLQLLFDNNENLTHIGLLFKDHYSILVVKE